MFVGVAVGVSVAVAVAVGVGVSVGVGGVPVTVAVAVGVAVGGATHAISSVTVKIAPRSELALSLAQNCQVPYALWPTKPEKFVKVLTALSWLGTNEHTPFSWHTFCDVDTPVPIDSALSAPASVNVIG